MSESRSHIPVLTLALAATALYASVLLGGIIYGKLFETPWSLSRGCDAANCVAAVQDNQVVDMLANDNKESVQEKLKSDDPKTRFETSSQPMVDRREAPSSHGEQHSYGSKATAGNGTYKENIRPDRWLQLLPD